MFRLFKSPDNPSEKEIKDLLFELFHCKTNNPQLYLQAFRHKSMVSQTDDSSLLSNERLEFLGDAILEAIITAHIYRIYPDKNEGILSKLRSQIVCRENLNKVAFEMHLYDQIEIKQENQLKMGSIVGNAMEALIGALYIDKGYDKTAEIIAENIVNKFMDLDDLLSDDHNYKSRIHCWTQKNKKTIKFETTQVLELKNSREYTVNLYIEGEAVGTGIGNSKKRAEQNSAEQVCRMLQL